MTIFESLTTLNELINKNALPFILNSDSTLEEIKKAYKRLSKIYHPDNYMNDEAKRLENEEIMKEINSAYETLEKRFNSSSHTERIDLEAMKKEYIKKMEHYNNVNTNEDTMKAHNEIAMQIVLYTASINNAKTEKEIKNNFDKFKNEIFVIYANLIERFFNKYLINKDEVTETISFGLSLDEFYNKLLEIKAKYSPLAKIEELLEPFKNYAGYTELENVINSTAEKIKEEIRKKEITIDDALTKITSNINFIFKRYYEVKEKINKLKEDKNINLAILKELEQIEEELKNIEDLTTIEGKVKELENKLIKIEKLKAQTIEMNKIYTEVMAKANSCLQGLNLEDNVIYTYINDCILRIINIFNFVYNNEVDIDILQLLNQITFSNLDVDNAIFDFIEAHLKSKQDMEDSERLFVRTKSFNSPDDVYSIYMILEINELYKMAKLTQNGDLVIEEISVEELENDFIPLANYLNKDNLIWKRYFGMGYSYYILYFYGNQRRSTIVLCKDGEEQSLQVNNWLVSSNRLDEIYDSELDVWKEPNYIMKQLVEQIKKELNKNYKRVRKTKYNN